MNRPAISRYLRFSRHHRSRAACGKPGRSLLRLEQLEERTTPATFTITNLADAGAGSLREAIALANANPDADTIVFDPSLARQTVALSTVGDTSVGPAAFLVSTPITIEGSGQAISRATETAFRLFTVSGTGSLVLRDLVLVNGLARGTDGTSGGGGGAGLGGAIYNQGSLQIFGSTLASNQAVGGNGTTGSGSSSGAGGGLGGTESGVPSGYGHGGASGDIQVYGRIVPPGAGYGQPGNFGGGGGAGGGGIQIIPGGQTSSWSSAGGNGGFAGGHGGHGLATGRPPFFQISIGTGGGGAGLGGGLFNQGGTVTIANSTLVANVALGGKGGYGGSGFGGGIFNLNGTLTLTNATVAGNSVGGGALWGIIFSDATPGAAAGGALYNLSLDVGTATPTQNAGVHLANSILADTLDGANDVVNNQINGGATLVAHGPNLVTVTVVNQGGGLLGVPFLVADPQLASADYHGGPTPTMPLLAGSPAANAGDTAQLSAANFGGTYPLHDQRGPGFPRTVAGLVDLGATEGPLGWIAASADVGGPATVRMLTPAGTMLGEFAPYGSSFTGGIRTALADITGDGMPELFTAPGPGHEPVVHIYDSRTYTLLAQRQVFGDGFTGGVNLAVADVLGDGRPELLAAPDTGGSPVVNVFDLATGAFVTRLQVFGDGYVGGVRVAAGNVTGDDRAEIIVAAQAGAPLVNVYDATTGARLAQIEAFGPTFTGGLYVAAGDVDEDGCEDILVGPGAGAPVVNVFSGRTGERLAQRTLYDEAFSGGVRVAAMDVDGDGADDLLASPGPGGTPLARVLEVLTGAELEAFMPFGDTMRAGLFLAGCDLD